MARLWASFVAVFSALGAFLFGLDIGYIAPILECASFKRDVAHLPNWHEPLSQIPDATVGFIVGVFSIGCIFTSSPLVSGYFLDEWGRRSSIMLGSFIFLVGCSVQAVAASITVILIGRLIAGMSIGLLSSVVALYQSELAPPSMRGALTSLYQLMITLGILVAAAVDNLVVAQDGGWRWAIWLQALPAGSLLLAMPLLPRSPRWLVQKGRQEEAFEALRAVREEEAEARQELQEIIESHEKALALGKPQWHELVEGRTGQLLLLGVTLQLLQQLVGMNAFMYFGPRIFSILALDANLFQTITNAVNFASTFPALVIVDRFGRRVLLICSAVGMTMACLCMGAVGQVSFSEQNGTWTTSSPKGGSAIAAMVFFFVVNFAYGWGPIVWVYNSEIFPLKYRSWCVATTACANWVGNYAVAQSTPVLLGRLGFGTFYVFAVFTLAALGLAVWLPETKGVVLERIDEIFDEKLGLPESKGLTSSRVASSGPKISRASQSPVVYGAANDLDAESEDLVKSGA